MQIPTPVASIEWMRELFGALEKSANLEASALPDSIASVIHNPPPDIPRLKRWILRVCTIAETKPSQLAREANLSPSTVNRFLKDGNTSAGLNANTISALVDAGDVLARKAASRKEFGSFKLSNIMILQEPRYNRPRKTRFANGLMDVPVMGILGLNNEWMTDTFQSDMKEEYRIVVPENDRYADAYAFAFELMDMSDDRAEDTRKEIVVCIPAWFDTVHLRGDERVIIVERPKLQTVTAGIRDLSRDDRGNIWLMPLHGDIGVIEPAFLGRDKVPLLKAKLGIAMVVIASYRSFL